MKKLTSIILCVALLALVACSQNELTPIDENDVPVEKFVGSREERAWVSYAPAKSFEEIVAISHRLSGKIVIGKVESAETRVFTQEWEGVPTIHEDVTDYTIAVHETLFGDTAKSLTLAIGGLPDCNNGLTKPSIGDTLLLLLWQAQCGNHGLVYWEESMFRIEDDGTLYSFSDNPLTARFDGLSVETLTSEINMALSRAERGELLCPLQRSVAESADWDDE